MEYRNRRRIWAWLSALWLVAACLAGCRLPVTGGMGTVEQAKDGGRQWEETRYSDGTGGGIGIGAVGWGRKSGSTV